MGFCEIAGDLGRRMGVGGNYQADTCGGGELQESRRRVGFGAGLVPAGGVQLDDRSIRGDGLNHGIVEAVEIAGRDVREFFHQIRVGKDVEEAGLRHLRVGFPILRPCGIDIGLRPFA